MLSRLQVYIYILLYIIYIIIISYCFRFFWFSILGFAISEVQRAPWTSQTHQSPTRGKSLGDGEVDCGGAVVTHVISSQLTNIAMIHFSLDLVRWSRCVVNLNYSIHMYSYVFMNSRNFISSSTCSTSIKPYQSRGGDSHPRTCGRGPPSFATAMLSPGWPTRQRKVKPKSSRCRCAHWMKDFQCWSVILRSFFSILS